MVYIMVLYRLHGTELSSRVDKCRRKQAKVQGNLYTVYNSHCYQVSLGYIINHISK